MEGRGLNFALVGCGRISRKYAEAFTSDKLPGSRLIAVCDVKYERAKALGSRLEIPYYRCQHEMMQSHPEIDVVNILSESGLHAEHCLDLVKYKKHMVVEKPMALTMQDADAMIQACANANIRLFVVKQNRYNRPVKLLMRALGEGRFGRVFMVTARVRWARHNEYYEQDQWRGTYKYDGGVFANQACHYIDLIQSIMGVPDQVFARGTRVGAPIEAEDLGVAVFTNGPVIGVLEATTATRPGDLEGSLSVLGEFGSVELSGVALNEVRTWRFQSATPYDEQILESSCELTDSVYGFGHTAYLADVVRVLSTGEKGAVDGVEGRKTVDILSAIYESMATGKEVSVDGNYTNSLLGRESNFAVPRLSPGGGELQESLFVTSYSSVS